MDDIPVGFKCPLCGVASDHVTKTVSELMEYPDFLKVNKNGELIRTTDWDCGELVEGDSPYTVDHRCPKCYEELTEREVHEGVKKYIEEELENEEKADAYARLLKGE